MTSRIAGGARAVAVAEGHVTIRADEDLLGAVCSSEEREAREGSAVDHLDWQCRIVSQAERRANGVVYNSARNRTDQEAAPARRKADRRAGGNVVRVRSLWRNDKRPIVNDDSDIAHVPTVLSWRQPAR